MSLPISVAGLEAALSAMRVALLGGNAPRGGWVPVGTDPETVVWPFCELELQITHTVPEVAATVIETVHANDRNEVLTIADTIAGAIANRSYQHGTVRIVGHEYVAGPQVRRSVTGCRAQLTWRVLAVWRS